MANIEEQLQNLVLSDIELSNMTGWPPKMIEDYLNIIRNFILIAANADTTTDQVEANTTNIEINTTTIDDHITSDSEHGVTGVNIGTEDFCTELVGGVVLLSALVNNAVDSTVSVDSPDASAAPAVYSQTQIQEIVTLANEMKADINQLVTDVNNSITQINDFIAKNKTASQMNTV